MNVETRPAKVDAWLAELEARLDADLRERAASLADFLAACNGADIPLSQREHLVEAVYPVHVRFVSELLERMAHAPLPLPSRLRPEFETMLRLSDAYREACARIIAVSFQPGRKHWLRQPDPAPLRRRMAALYVLQGLCLDLHEPLPQGFWAEAHATYKQAREHKVHKFESTPGEGDSVSRSYKSILLLELADPYRLTHRERVWTQQLIGRFAHLASIRVRTPESLDSCPFLIDSDHDRPPRPRVLDHSPIESRGDLALDTLKLIRQLSLVEMRLPGAPEDRLGSYRRHLHRQRLQWSAAQLRLAARHRNENLPTQELCVGFGALHRLLSAMAEQGRAGAADVPLGKAADVPAPAQDAAPAGDNAGLPPPQTYLARVENFSLGGMALSLPAGIGLVLRVGAVIGHRRVGEGPWSLGVIRWFRTGARGRISLGLQALSHHLEAGQLTDAGLSLPVLLAPCPVEAGCSLMVTEGTRSIPASARVGTAAQTSAGLAELRALDLVSVGVLYRVRLATEDAMDQTPGA